MSVPGAPSPKDRAAEVAALGVALDVSAVPASPVGAGRYIVELVRALAGHPEVRLTLVSRRDDARRWRGLHPAAALVPAAPASRPLRVAWEDLALGPLLGRLPGLGVLHAPHYSMPRRPAHPCVVTVHDCTFLDHPEWHERSKVVWFSHALHRAAREAAVVVCPSATTAERFAALCHPRCPVLVVPHGVDHDHFAPGEPEPGADAALLDALGVVAPYVLHLGTLEPRKDVATLLRAFALVERPDLELLLAGPPGWGGRALARAEAELPPAVSRRVRRLGYVADEALPALLRGCSAFAYASLEEGFGVPVLEALACGAPLVTSRATVMSDLAAGAAVLAEAGDAASLAASLDEVLAGGAAAAARRAAGIARAASMTWEASASGHLEAYRVAAGGAPPAEPGPSTAAAAHR